MRLSDQGIIFLIKEEGMLLKPYRDQSGYPTIGIGNRFYINGDQVKMTDPPITRAQALELFQKTLQIYETNLNKVLKQKLNQNQFDACISLSYNIGIKGFNESTALKRINKNPEDPGIYEAYLRWIRAKQHKTLLRPRRIREARLYFEKINSEYHSDTKTEENGKDQGNFTEPGRTQNANLGEMGI